MRAGTFKALDTVKETDFDKPAPETVPRLLPDHRARSFCCSRQHWLMHAGQWAIVRRKLGKPPLF